jgi:hypothetical protein
MYQQVLEDWMLCQCAAWGCASVQHMLVWIRWILRRSIVYIRGGGESSSYFGTLSLSSSYLHTLSLR